MCWKIEQLHREMKQGSGIVKCQCCKHRVHRNHIACCLWVWVSLTRAARAVGQTIYQIKQSLLDDYLRQQNANTFNFYQYCVGPNKFWIIPYLKDRFSLAKTCLIVIHCASYIHLTCFKSPKIM